MAEKAKNYNSGQVGNTGTAAADNVKVFEQKSGGGSMWLWLIPILLLAGLLIWYFNRDHTPAVANTSSIGAVYFATGSAALTPEDRTTLDTVASSMQSNPDQGVRIKGYTDSTGDQAQNIALSNQRADAVQNYFVSKGIDKSRLSMEGFGQVNPPGTEGSSDGADASNRRVELFPR